MRNTNYYDLKVIEGTDIFNPLAVDPDNLDLIDEVMHENASASITTATELTSGTVHSLVRDNADASVFRFVATSNATTGDTYTVDGIQVTALKPNGTPLSDNDYVINANVLCVLVGTLLTIYVSGTVETAADSEKLGGELPSYYGKASDVTTALESASGAQTIANMAMATVGNKSGYPDIDNRSQNYINMAVGSEYSAPYDGWCRFYITGSDPQFQANIKQNGGTIEDLACYCWNTTGCVWLPVKEGDKIIIKANTQPAIAYMRFYPNR